MRGAMSRLRTSLLAVLLTSSITSVMSVVFHGTIRVDFLVTGFVCAVIVEGVVSQIGKRYRAALRAANRRFQEQLVDAERLATAGNAAAGVCHEIQNPLAALLGSLELAQELFEEDPPDR